MIKRSVKSIVSFLLNRMYWLLLFSPLVAAVALEIGTVFFYLNVLGDINSVTYG